MFYFFDLGVRIQRIEDRKQNLDSASAYQMFHSVICYLLSVICHLFSVICYPTPDT